MVMTVEDRVRLKPEDRALGRADLGGRPGRCRAIARRVPGLCAHGRFGARVAGLGSSLIGLVAAVRPSPVGVLRLSLSQCVWRSRSREPFACDGEGPDHIAGVGVLG